LTVLAKLTVWAVPGQWEPASHIEKISKKGPLVTAT